MLLSMTGHGAASSTVGRTTVSVELRTINSRYLKFAVRTPEGYSALERPVEELLRKFVRRGTIQVQLQISRQSTVEDYQIDEVVLQGYRDQLQSLDAEPSIDTLLTLPGVVVEKTAGPEDAEQIWEQVREVVEQAQSRLQAMRVDEGRAMATDLSENCDAIAKEIEAIAERAPEVANAYSERLLDRINKLLDQHGVQIEPANIVREVGMFAERADVSEELVRLNSHIEQFHRFVDSPESNGRKLDFLIQEMFRETNTIGSKANDVDIATRVVQIKSCIERMREMIQNVE